MRKMLVLLPLLALCAGCTLLGKNAGPPTALEKDLFSVSNAVIPKVVQVTNLVTLYQTNVALQVVTVTNSIGVPVTQTNVVTVTQTNIVPQVATVTNFVTVPQLVPGVGQQTATGLAGTVAGFWGAGGLATTILGGIFAAYLGARNRALAGNVDTATQASGVLAQNVQTVLSVLTATPQGQAALPAVKAYLMKHQLASGVIEQVAEAVKTVDPLEAQGAAQAVLNAVNTLQNPAPTQGAEVATKAAPVAKVA